MIEIETDIPDGSGRWGWKRGDRVTRPVNVYDQSSRSSLKHGVVIRCYSQTGGRFGPYPELYDVRWDNGTVERRFLGHGLQREE